MNNKGSCYEYVRDFGWIPQQSTKSTYLDIQIASLLLCQAKLHDRKLISEIGESRSDKLIDVYMENCWLEHVDVIILIFL